MMPKDQRNGVYVADDYPNDLQHYPNDLKHPGCGRPQAITPRLMRVSEVDQACAPDSTPASVVKWLREFIARPHPQLGRGGSICPLVPYALRVDSIWITEVPQENPTIESISAIITQYRTVFLETEPVKGPEALNKAFLIVFPSLVSKGADGAALIDKVQYRLKPYFVEKGIMLGEFHAANESPGLRNPAFRPLRSPVPMLAIRHMVESDLPFMTRTTYTPKERSVFLRSYLFRLGGTLTLPAFNAALDSLIASESCSSIGESQAAKQG
jgi:hypothetical protein